MTDKHVVAVTGGRKYADKSRVYAELDGLHVQQPITTLVVGDATGADCWARCWATERQVPLRVFYADWAQYGRRAGHLRNREMLEASKPSLLVAFPGGPGTANCVHNAQELSIPIRRIVDQKISDTSAGLAVGK